MDIKKIIALNIYSLRNQYKLTQEEFAARLNINITRGHVSRIENGNHIPSAEFIKAVSDTFDVSANWLIASNGHSAPSDFLLKNELELITKYRKLPVPVQDKILELINSILSA